MNLLDHKALLGRLPHKQVMKGYIYIQKNVAVNSYCGSPEEEHWTQKFILKLEQFKD